MNNAIYYEEILQKINYFTNCEEELFNLLSDDLTFSIFKWILDLQINKNGRKSSSTLFRAI